VVDITNRVINSAAYTLVDKAETDQEQAYAVNCLGPENLSLAASEFDCVLLHDETNPKTVYGLTKLQGDKGLASN